MTSPISTSTSTSFSSVRDPLRETAQRRKIEAELVEIGKGLKQFPMRENALSTMLTEWYDCFSAKFKRDSDAGKVCNEFIGRLQSFLIDPISSQSLDDQSVLGTDGRTYGFSSLREYLSDPKSDIKRSPLAPLNTEEFRTTPHHHARHMVDWLRRMNPQSSSTAKDLLEQKSEAEVPLSQHTDLDKFRQIKKVEAMRRAKRLRNKEQKENERLQKSEEFEANLERNELNSIRESFQPLRTQLRNSHKENLDQTKTRRENFEEDVNKLKDQLPSLEERAKNLKDKSEKLGEDIKDTKKKNNEAEKENKILEKKIVDLDKRITEARKKAVNDLLGVLTTFGSTLGICAGQRNFSSYKSNTEISLTDTFGGSYIKWNIPD